MRVLLEFGRELIQCLPACDVVWILQLRLLAGRCVSSFFWKSIARSWVFISPEVSLVRQRTYHSLSVHRQAKVLADLSDRELLRDFVGIELR